VFRYLEPRHWFFIALLVFLNIAIFGCVILLLLGRFSFS
jgi:hypothetical protein